MTRYLLSDAVVGTSSDLPHASDPLAGAKSVPTALYIESDTGAIKLSTGEGWVTVGQLTAGALPAGVTSDLATPGGIVVAGDIQGATSLNVGDLTNLPDPTIPLQVGPGGNAFWVGTAGDGHFLSTINCAGITSGGPNSLVAADAASVGATAVGKGTLTTDGDTFQAVNNVGVVARVDGAGNIRTQTGLGVFAHAAPSSQPLLATGAGHTVDDVITLLQSYGFCKQS